MALGQTFPDWFTYNWWNGYHSRVMCSNYSFLWKQHCKNFYTGSYIFISYFGTRQQLSAVVLDTVLAIIHPV